jgi:ABC-2 type transport system permease protein
MIYVLFFFFFVMLVVSNATITGMGLFRKRETGWLLSLPIPFKSLVLWQTLEGMVLASWGLLLLSAPILAAIGRVLDAPPSFFFLTLPALLCLVTIASNTSSWILLLLVRWMKRSWLKPLAITCLAIIVTIAIVCWPQPHTTSSAMDVGVHVSSILHHSDHFTHPLLPSSWVAQVVIAASRGEVKEAGFHNLLLLSNALVSLVITMILAGFLFYPAWSRTLEPGGANRHAGDRGYRWPRWLAWLPLPDTDRALVLKDVHTFLREPAQWGQCAVVFGLLFLYTGNLRRIVFDYHDPFWAVVTSYLNLLVCSLSLSTLTTRFIYPQISQEGQRLWLFGLSPVNASRMLRVKLRLTLFVTGTLTTTLTLISCQTLAMNWERTVFFLVCILMLTFGLNGLALGLGVIFPNFREVNPAKIVSGFGGTLCLIASFIYIAAAMAVALIPSLPELRPGGLFNVAHRMQAMIGSACGLLLLTYVFGGLPYWFAQKKIKSLDYFEKI